MARSPGSLESLRRLNRSRVLGVLQLRGAASQADIVRETGLSRTTVSSLVAELIQEGAVVEPSEPARHAPSPNGGRPPTLLTLDPSSGGFVGVDVFFVKPKPGASSAALVTLGTIIAP